MQVNISSHSLVVIPANCRRELTRLRRFKQSAIRNITNHLLFAYRRSIVNIRRNVKSLASKRVLILLYKFRKNHCCAGIQTLEIFTNMNLAITNVENSRCFHLVARGKIIHQLD